MVFKRFRITCIIRIILISANILGLVLLITETQLYATTLIVGLAALYQIYSLINFVEFTNRNLSRFLNSIKYSDFAQSFSSKVKGTSFEELNEAFNSVIYEFQQTRTEKEEHFLYLQTVVQHVGIGLMAYTRQGDVELYNNVAKRLLRIPHLPSLKHLTKNQPELAQLLSVIRPGERHLIKIKRDEEELQLSLAATEFVLHHDHYLLVSMQNIQSELEETELESWQKLIRVLTHEIMNSITPITSLAGTANSLLTSMEQECDAADDSDLKDIRTAVETIQNRSTGLLDFVQNYRQLSRLPKPMMVTFSVLELITRVVNLMQDSVDSAKIDLVVAVYPDKLELTADPTQIEQVLINLLKNAIEAVNETANPRIKISAKIDISSRPIIAVSDNGQGITDENLSRIFIPFYTTKREGSGIGLSLSRQIMRLHRGNLTVRSRPFENTSFIMRF